MKEEVKLANDISNGINNLSFSVPEFINAMCLEHRTLQQKFTGICLKWIEHVASEDYRTDGRNVLSHEKCKKIIALMKENDINTHIPTI